MYELCNDTECVRGGGTMSSPLNSLMHIEWRPICHIMRQCFSLILLLLPSNECTLTHARIDTVKIELKTLLDRCRTWVIPAAAVSFVSSYVNAVAVDSRGEARGRKPNWFSRFDLFVLVFSSSFYTAFFYRDSDLAPPFILLFMIIVVVVFFTVIIVCRYACASTGFFFIGIIIMCRSDKSGGLSLQWTIQYHDFADAVPSQQQFI